MRMLHHPYCTKSCAALDFIQQNQITAEVIDLTRHFPDRDELLALVDMLEIPVIELVRTGEPLYVRKYAGKDLSDEELMDILQTHPDLLQRPIFIEGNRAVIGRPPERIFELFT